MKAVFFISTPVMLFVSSSWVLNYSNSPQYFFSCCWQHYTVVLVSKETTYLHYIKKFKYWQKYKNEIICLHLSKNNKTNAENVVLLKCHPVLAVFLNLQYKSMTVLIATALQIINITHTNIPKSSTSLGILIWE